ncbi:hypothetical protein BD413DRAFT_548014 [Trametes elegans]|nr:hypothetical protein BD413DRAFT_548014 [Trametes elegans]
MDPADVAAELNLTTQERIQRAISRLPVLSKAEVPQNDPCPICLNPFDTLLDGKPVEAAPDLESHLTGVTKLVACGHIFCRPCLVEWIRGRHGSCPSCRNVFSGIQPASDDEYDDESTDDDYEPGDDEDDDEDGFSDGAMDTESVFDDMDIEDEIDVDVDVDIDDDMDIGLWDDAATDAGIENWGLSDGDGSESLSEVEVLALSTELEPQNDDAEVYSDGADASGSLQAPEDDSSEPK